MKSNKFLGFGLFEHFESKDKPKQSSGYIVFGRDPNFSNIDSPMIIPEGFRVYSKDNRAYVVTKDKTSEYWSNIDKAYVVPPGIEMAGILCTASLYKVNENNKFEMVVGEKGNCKKGEIEMCANTQFVIKPIGCDYWWNSLDFDNGVSQSPKNIMRK